MISSGLRWIKPLLILFVAFAACFALHPSGVAASVKDERVIALWSAKSNGDNVHAKSSGVDRDRKFGVLGMIKIRGFSVNRVDCDFILRENFC